MSLFERIIKFKQEESVTIKPTDNTTPRLDSDTVRFPTTESLQYLRDDEIALILRKLPYFIDIFCLEPILSPLYPKTIVTPSVRTHVIEQLVTIRKLIHVYNIHITFDDIVAAMVHGDKVININVDFEERVYHVRMLFAKIYRGMLDKLCWLEQRYGDKELSYQQGVELSYRQLDRKKYIDRKQFVALLLEVVRILENTNPTSQLGVIPAVPDTRYARIDHEYMGTFEQVYDSFKAIHYTLLKYFFDRNILPANNKGRRLISTLIKRWEALHEDDPETNPLPIARYILKLYTDILNEYNRETLES